MRLHPFRPLESGPPPTILIASHGRQRTAARSRREPNALVMDCEGSCLARNGTVVKTSRQVFLFIVAVAAHPDAMVSTTELSELLFVGQDDGGADNAEGSVSTLAFRATPVLAALGYRLETKWGRGRFVRCCISPVPVTYSDLADQELSHA